MGAPWVVLGRLRALDSEWPVTRRTQHLSSIPRLSRPGSRSSPPLTSFLPAIRATLALLACRCHCPLDSASTAQFTPSPHALRSVPFARYVRTAHARPYLSYAIPTSAGAPAPCKSSVIIDHSALLSATTCTVEASHGPFRRILTSLHHHPSARLRRRPSTQSCLCCCFFFFLFFCRLICTSRIRS